MVRQSFIQSFLAATVLVATSAAADDYMHPMGFTPPAEDLGHVFFTVCHPSMPLMMDDRITLAQTAFGWEPVDMGTDAAFQTPDGALTVSLDRSTLQATCEMTITAQVGGDGGDLYEDLEAHLAQDTGGDLPEADYTDGGVVWMWESSARYTLTYTESDAGFTITLNADS